MTTQKDRIEAAIRHIQTAADVDPWAMELAVDALEKQIPKNVRVTTSTKRCAVCGRQLSGIVTSTLKEITASNVDRLLTGGLRNDKGRSH